MRTVVLALSGLWLLGCHTVPLRDDPLVPDHRESPSQGLFSVDWRVELVTPQMWEVNPREPAAPAIDPASGNVLVLTRNGRATCFTPDGKEVWHFDAHGPFFAGATIEDAVAYVPGGDGYVYALKANTGELLWKYHAGEQLVTEPVIADGKVLVASQASTLFALDAQTGAWLWQYRRDLPAGFLVEGASAPRVAGPVLFIGFPDGYVVALSLQDGAPKWERNLSGTGNQFLDVDTTPYLDDAGKLVVASYKSGLYALNPQNGDAYWSTNTPGTTQLLGRGEVVFTVGADGVGAVLADDGRSLWSVPIKGAVRGISYAHGLLAVPMSEALLFVDPASGKAALKWDPGQGVSAKPASVGDRLYVLSNQGYLYALRLERTGR